MTLYDSIYEEMQSTNNIEEYILQKKNVPIEMLLFIGYEHFKYRPVNDKIEHRIKRQYQQNFRKQLEKRYKKCIVTGKGSDVYEACHIIPYSESDYRKMYDVNNGLLLSSELHKLFDKFLVSINDDKFVLSKKILNDISYAEYKKYNGVQLFLNNETLKNLESHYKKFLQLNK